MVRFLRTTAAERQLSTEVNRMDDALTRLRDRIRQGDGLGADGLEVAYLKIDVQYAEEDTEFIREFGIPARKAYSGELCPDHCSVLVLGDAMRWARGPEAMSSSWRRPGSVSAAPPTSMEASASSSWRPRAE